MTEKKNFDELVNEISLKFTGDPETDFSLLFEEAGKIGDGDLARAVVRACSRVIERTLPEENRKKLERLSMTSAAVLNAEIEEIQFTLIKREYAKALPMAESLVRRIEDFKMYQDDSEEEFRCFDEFFEEILYYQIYKPSRKITRIGLNFHSIYFLYGNILFELKRFDEARAALLKGLHWNPIDFNLMSEYAETYKITGKMESFFDVTLDAFKIAFRPEHLARCYWNLGRCFRTKGLHEAANVCYYLSLRYKPAAKARSALFEIERETGTFFREPDEERIAEIAAQYGFPTGPDAGILDLANRSARFFLARRQYEDALYFLQIEFGLTESDETEALIDKAEAELLEKCRQEENEAEDTPDGEEEED